MLLQISRASLQAKADVQVTVSDANEAPELLLPSNITAKEGENELCSFFVSCFTLTSG